MREADYGVLYRSVGALELRVFTWALERRARRARVGQWRRQRLDMQLGRQPSEFFQLDDIFGFFFGREETRDQRGGQTVGKRPSDTRKDEPQRI